jgi:hypothetical protein
LTDKDLRDLFPDEAKGLIEYSGVELAEKLGLEAIREVVGDVFSGVNIRSAATESFTRRRVSLLNAALLVTFLRARADDPDFPIDSAEKAREEYARDGVSQVDKKLLLWMQGLTNKQVQNVLRQDDRAWQAYSESFSQDLAEIADQVSSTYGELEGTLRLGDGQEIPIDWLWAIYLVTAIGSQDRATRGAEKSLYGKFFEKLILGGVLHLLGFRLVDVDDISSDMVYWLSSSGALQRESDATALVSSGKGVRFDIGFIGTGNTEVSLDKVSRYQREIEIGGEQHFMHTAIIVDKVGKGSRIPGMAQKIGGTIHQMSGSYWPRELGEALEQAVDGYESPLAGVPDREMRPVIDAALADAPFEKILNIEKSADDEVV